MKGNKGITLIALVITIIVLLILAGVSIAMLSGDNSILNNASKSADYNKIGEVRDNIGIRINQNMAEFLDKKYNNATPGIDSIVASQTTAQAVINDVLSNFTAGTGDGHKYAPTNGATVTLPEGKVKIESNSYYVEGTIDSTTGAIEWGNITKAST